MPLNPRKSFLLGLIGEKIQQSRTPYMHQAEGDAQNLRILYQKIDLAELQRDVSALPQLIESARLMGFSGLNITHPCKQAIIPLLGSLSDEAAMIEAVNTVVFQEGKLIGYNTDCSGFQAAFQNKLAGADRDHIVQIGAGGAGSAVAYALLKSGVSGLAIYDQDVSRSEKLVHSLKNWFPLAETYVARDLPSEMKQARGLVHCTPMGMANYPGLPVEKQWLHPDLWVADIVYFPLETELLRVARELGCRTLNGAAMAVGQAVDAFTLFTGRVADMQRMTKYFDEAAMESFH